MKKFEKLSDIKFFEQDTLDVAKKLLGSYLVNEVDGIRLTGKIVEVEAYLGFEDKGSHTFGGRRTKRNEVMYGEAGTAYVYLTYGMHYLLNVVTREREVGQAVLIRGIEPLENIDEFSKNRFGLKYDELNSYQRKNLTNGPAKLTKAMKIDAKLNGKDMKSGSLYIVKNDDIFETVESKRIGIDYAEEAKDFLYRFYIKGNKFVSKY